VQQAALVSEDVAEFDNLITSVDLRWTAVQKAASESANRLADAMPLVESFSAGLHSLIAWMELAEGRYKWQSLSSDDTSVSAEASRAPVSQRLANAQLLLADIDRQRSEIDSLHDLSHRFLQLCDADKETVEQRMFDLESRWTQLKEGLYRSSFTVRFLFCFALSDLPITVQLFEKCGNNQLSSSTLESFCTCGIFPGFCQLVCFSHLQGTATLLEDLESKSRLRDELNELLADMDVGVSRAEAGLATIVQMTSLSEQNQLKELRVSIYN
jgi:hypothetical protein